MTATERPSSTRRGPAVPWLLLTFPGFKLVLHLLTFSGYGIFRDEFYYIACSEHLAWGYVDHPPFSIAVLWLTRTLLGEGLLALRLVPALLGSFTVLLIGLIARRLGGSVAAQCLAMISAILVPTYLGSSHVYSMNSIDLAVWALAAYLLLGIVRVSGDSGSAGKTGSSNRVPTKAPTGGWIRLGFLLGIGLLNKISVLWLGFGLGVGLLLTTQRTALRTRGPWLAGSVAGLVFMPHILWQIRHGWPTREFISNATGEKMVAVSPWQFVTSQVDMFGGPVLFGIAWIGLAFLLGAPSAKRYRILGWIYVAVFMLLMFNGTSRAGYLAPASTWLLAAGAVATTRILTRITSRGWRQTTTAALFLLVILQGSVAAPFGLPLLSIERFVSYAESLGAMPSTSERKEIGVLPQFYADMHGWQAKADAALRAADSLSTTDRDQACIFTYNYGVAGALEHLGVDDLPPVISGHNNYWFWGPGECTGEILIIMGGHAENLHKRFASVEVAETVECDYCMPYENHHDIVIVRGPYQPLIDREQWATLKHYD